MRNTLWRCVLLLLAVGALASPALAADKVLSVVTTATGAGTVTAYPGQTIDVDIQVDDAAMVAGAAFTVTFDAAMAFANGDLVTLQRNDGSQVVFEFNDGSAPLTATPVADNPATAGTNERVEVKGDFEAGAGDRYPTIGTIEVERINKI